VRWPGFLLRPFLRWYARRYGVALEEAEFPLEAYPSFVAFFTRRLKEGLRPLAEGEEVIISPVDGRIAQFGDIKEGTILQAKGIDYSVAEFLGDEEAAKRFAGGQFLTIYLSPKDYHRIHSPLEATIQAFHYLPGRLLPVNPPSVKHFPRLFVENERLVSDLEHPRAGALALVKVGATNVGRMRLYYTDFATNGWFSNRKQSVTLSSPAHLARGEELAVFELGSTVVLLFSPSVRLRPLEEGAVIRLGEAIADIH
jgi:phosphatidylserine decarboxylase